MKLIAGVQRRVTKLVTGMQGLNCNDRLKQLGLQRLQGRRIRSDRTETFKIVNRKYDINPDLLFQLDAADRNCSRHSCPLKGEQPPIFGPCLLWPNDWMDQDATWYGGRPRPRRHCVRWGPAPTTKGERPPNFRPMSTVAKRSTTSATAELLLL